MIEELENEIFLLKETVQQDLVRSNDSLNAKLAKQKA